jgi:hypothetical protein
MPKAFKTAPAKVVGVQRFAPLNNNSQTKKFFHFCD